MNTPLNSLPRIQEIYLQGRNSQKEIVIDIETVEKLVDAYLTKIPNEVRTMKMSLMVMRFHDSLKDMVLAEAKAVAEEAHQRTVKVFQEESEGTDDLPV